MSTYPSDEELQDNDPTDELPILTDVILGEAAEHTESMHEPSDAAEDTGRFQNPRDEAGQSAGAEKSAAAGLQKDLDARNERLSTLETELARLQARWSDTEATLSERDTELSRLRAELADREAAIAEQRTALEHNSEELRAHKTTITELTSALESERDRAAGLERSSNDLEQQIKGLEQKIKEIETEHAIAREDAKQVGDDATVTRLRDEVAALSQHIENRNAVWHDQAEKLAAQSIRNRELEIEVAQRLERQLEAESFAATEAASARAAREKLGEALETLKRRKPVDERPEAPQTSEPEPIADADRAAQLRRELAQTVILQASQGEDAGTLSRLAELEAAIRSLENQMQTEREPLDTVPSREPAKLVCLTTEAPTDYPLDKTTLTIGRGTTCDIQIGTHYVSREHARITTTDTGCFIEDLGSRNGVFVNAVKVERQDLEANDLITVGDTQFRYQAGGNG
ncbi:MAG: FHA domain-containing protein [Gammaproteobacteria bacterium]|nr:FHA domain-containing protein [Gammaproteobacteria bacterium]MDH3507998.1 FHA domain-containing protein [Gammaproteobacteria bacterium]